MAESLDIAMKAEYAPDGPVAQRIAAATPAFPFKGIPAFYDISGILKDPEIFQLVVDIFVERYREIGVDSVCGLDARGFIFGPPIALALKKPFFMLRKQGKLPNMVTGSSYSKEYAGTSTLGVPRGAIAEGDRVLVIDDLVATGGTLSAAVELIKMMKGTVVECACIIELKFLNAKQKFKDLGYEDVPIWALVSESCAFPSGLETEPLMSHAECAAGTNVKGVLYVNQRGVYVDDGEAH